MDEQLHCDNLTIRSNQALAELKIIIGHYKIIIKYRYKSAVVNHYKLINYSGVKKA